MLPSVCSIQQYHSALLLLMEIFANPKRKEAKRIWRCLDYVFEIPTHIPKEQKGRWVMTEIRDKMGLYVASRKLMAPSSLLERMGNQPSQSQPATNSSTFSPISVGKVSQSSIDPSHGAPVAMEQATQGYEGIVGGSSAYINAAGPPPGMPAAAPPMQADKILDIDWVCAIHLMSSRIMLIRAAARMGQNLSSGCECQLFDIVGLYKTMVGV